MSIAKQKIRNHIIEEESLNIIRKKFPKYWTIREYKPDYGLDLSVEVFEESAISSDKDIRYETLGEHFFIQLKGTEHLKKGKYKIFEEFNVEKQKSNLGNNKVLYKSIDVVKFVIETSELITVERMSPSIPVFLFVVDIKSEEVYFVCLNDYIEKVIIPCDPNYHLKKSTTIYIPIENVLNNETMAIIRFYAKRPKLYSFFIKGRYQASELKYIMDEELKNYYPYFIEKLLRYDIWSIKNNWYPLIDIHKKLITLQEKNEINLFAPNKNFDKVERIYETGNSMGLLTEEEASFYNSIRMLWTSIVDISDMYEDYSRCWHLPTYFNVLGNN